MSFKETLTNILNLKLLENGAYLRMPNEEWSIKIMVHLLLNSGIVLDVSETLKTDLI